MPTAPIVDFAAPFRNSLRDLGNTFAQGDELRRQREQDAREQEKYLLLMGEASRKRRIRDAEGNAMAEASRPSDNPAYAGWNENLSAGMEQGNTREQSLAGVGQAPDKMIQPSLIEMTGRTAKALMQNPETAERGRELLMSTLDGLGGMMKVGAGPDAVALYNKILGTDFKYQGEDDKYHIVEGNGKVLAINKSALAAGKSLPEATQELDMGKKEKMVERTVDLGDQVEYIYTDGSRELKAKGKSPSTGDGGLTTAQRGSRTSLMRKEFMANPIVKNYNMLSNQAGTLSAVFNNKGDFVTLNPTDQALIMTFNRALDPTSVVRESEYARTPENMSVLNRAQALLSRWEKGGVLEDDERKSIVQAVGVVKEASKEQYTAYRDWMGENATAEGLDPKNVIQPLSVTKDTVPAAVTAAPKGTPKVGEVIKGYRYKGGDPSKKENWEAAQ
jgi:hypothetical protein